MSTSPVRSRTAAEISKFVLESAFTVHSTLGPGLLESVYEACLAQELRNRGFHVQQQVAVPVVYQGAKLEAGYRIDLLVENLCHRGDQEC